MLANFPLDDPIIARLFVLLHTDPTAGDLAEALAMDTAEWTAVLSLATDQHVHPYLYWNLQRLDVLGSLPESERSRLHAAYLSNAARNHVLLHALEPVLDVFAEHSIPVIVLKGVYLADQVYASIGARTVGDTDLLLPTDRIGEAVTLLETLGYVGSTPFDPALLAAHKHLPAYKRDGYTLEVHHSLLCPDNPLPINAVDLWERAVPVTVAGRPAFALGAEDQILHLCVHGAMEHQMNLDMRFLIDVVTYSSYAAQWLDWDVVVRRAQRLGWTRSVWLVLNLARELLGAQVPPYVDRQLMPEAVDPRIKEMAVAQLFDPRCTCSTDSREFAKLWVQGDSNAHKWQHLWRRLFLPRSLMAFQYHVAVDSPRLPLYYALRAKDLAFGYLPRAWDMLRGEESTRDLVMRTGEFNRWLVTPEPGYEVNHCSAEDR